MSQQLAFALDTDVETIASPDNATIASYDTISFGTQSPLFKKAIQLYRQGLAAYLSGDYLRAIDAFENALRLDPLHEECLILLNRAKAKRGIKEIKSDIEGDSAQALMQHQLDLYNAGMKDFAAQQYGEAKRNWSLLHDINPHYPLVISYLAKASAEIEAIEERKNADARAESVFKQANTEYMSGNLPRARDLLDSALSLSPSHAAALSLSARIRGEIKKQQEQAFNKGIASYKQGNYLEALNTWRAALPLDTSNARVAGHIAETQRHIEEIKKLHIAEGKKYRNAKKIKHALNEYEQAALLDPENAGIQKIISKLHSEYSSAVTQRYDSAVTLFKSAKYHEATALLEQVLIYDPGHATAKEYLEQCQKHIDAQQRKEQIAALQKDAEKLQQDGQFTQAADAWQGIVSLDSLNANARQQLSVCRNKAKAQKANLASQDMFRRSIAEYQKGRIRKARHMWKEILARDPQNQTVLHMLKKIDAEASAQIARAKNYSKQKKWQKAVAAYGRALQLSPDNSAAKTGLEEAKKQQAQQKQVAQKQQEAAPVAQADPAKINELFNKGLDLYMQKKFDKALAEWNMVLKLDPNNQRATTYIKNLEKKLERLKQL